MIRDVTPADWARLAEQVRSACEASQRLRELYLESSAERVERGMVIEQPLGLGLQPYEWQTEP